MKISGEENHIQFDGWPEFPYKGLNYYGPRDIPIFSGRDEDVFDCLELINNAKNSILLLHGTTGCGKSSFLRAGLIPMMEKRERGYSFVRGGKENSTALFVRSSSDPLSQLAELVFNLSLDATIEVNSPVGVNKISLRNCIPTEINDVEEFIELVSDDPDILVKSLSMMARSIPGTLVLIIDQMEELFTLRPGPVGKKLREQFMLFMDAFIDRKTDMKIILAIRTEYFGRLFDNLRKSLLTTDGVTHYFLSEFSVSQIVESIKRPTLTKPVDGYGAPFDTYKFKYSDKLPLLIAKELVDSVPAGGVLPVMQIVCNRLYKLVREKRGSNKITLKEYRELGGLSGQLAEHVTEAIETIYSDTELNKEEVDIECQRWKVVLDSLSRKQIDGTVTTEVKTTNELADEVSARLIKIPANDGFRVLTSEKYRVLREFPVFNRVSKKEIPCYALGHDAIGLALENVSFTSMSAKSIADRFLRAGRLINTLFGLTLIVGNLVGFILINFSFTQISSDTLFALNVIGVTYFALFKAIFSPKLAPHFMEVASRYAALFGAKRTSVRYSELADLIRLARHDQ